MAAEKKPIKKIEYVQLDNSILTFDFYRDGKTRIYHLGLNLEYKKKIKLCIDGDIVETSVSKYPTFKDEIIFSTIVKDEDNYIKQWIDFHLKIGVTRFIIYDNSCNNTLSELLKTYINKKQVLLIRWNFPYFLRKSGLSGQTTQQNHSIYAFQHSKYIGLFDVDEYVNMQYKTDIDVFFEYLIKKERVKINEISSFQLENKMFFNPYNLPTDNIQFFKIFTCREVNRKGRHKNFVLPKNVKMFCIHKVVDGKPMYRVSEKYIYFNHYFFLGKLTRGRNKDRYVARYIDSSILRHLDKDKFLRKEIFVIRLTQLMKLCIHLMGLCLQRLLKIKIIKASTGEGV